MDMMIKNGNRVFKFGETPMEFLSEDLKRLLNERLGKGIIIESLELRDLWLK